MISIKSLKILSHDQKQWILPSSLSHFINTHIAELRYFFFPSSFSPYVIRAYNDQVLQLERAFLNPLGQGGDYAEMK